MGRFEDVGTEVEDMVRRIKDNDFPELVHARIKTLFNTKKKMSGGKIVLGSIQKTNEIIRHFTIDESGNDEGFDYLLYFDKICWDNVDVEMQIKLIRHELQHCTVNIEARGNPYGLRGHEISDFYQEIEKNQDDPRWAERAAEITLHQYEQQE